jgi:hypothetical protein
MKRLLLFLFALVAFMFVTFPTSAADNVASKTLTVQSHARIITPITLTNTGAQPLDFGVIARGLSSSTVVVAPSNTPPVNVTGDAVVLTSSPQTAAKFDVTGENAKTYAITLPTTPQPITDGTNTLNITGFTWSNGAGTTGTIGTGNTFYVGGTLTVPETAVAAVYTGTFSVTVAYN